jgi:hypothetical protein
VFRVAALLAFALTFLEKDVAAQFDTFDTDRDRVANDELSFVLLPTLVAEVASRICGSPDSLASAIGFPHRRPIREPPRFHGDVVAGSDATVADEHVWARDQLSHLCPRRAARRATRSE